MGVFLMNTQAMLRPVTCCLSVTVYLKISFVTLFINGGRADFMFVFSSCNFTSEIFKDLALGRCFTTHYYTLLQKQPMTKLTVKYVWQEKLKKAVKLPLILKKVQNHQCLYEKYKLLGKIGKNGFFQRLCISQI